VATYYIWQCDDQGDRVRVVTDGQYRGVNSRVDTNPAPTISGTSLTGGQRILLIQPNGSIQLDVISF
jgi:hypothetical protein